jgi:Flp pilus assembly pilin Flp
MTRTVWDEGGQATVEHAALAALVAVVLTAAVAVAGGFSGVGIANAVHSGIRRALCVAGGDGCAPFHVQLPCTTARDEDTHTTGASIGIWRIGSSTALAVERRSDGSAAVTVFEDVEGGVGLSVGARFGLGRNAKGDRRLVRVGDDAPGFDVSAGVEARLRGGWGRTWEFRDGPAADAFVRRYAAREKAKDEGGDVAAHRIPPPDVERVRVGADATVTGEASGALGIDLSASGFRGLRGEGARDRRTGRITLSLGVPSAVAGDLAGPLGLALGGGLEVEQGATIVLDRTGRPVELRLLGRRSTRGEDRRRDVQLRVDLTRPAAGAGLRSVLDALADGDGRRARDAAKALGRWAAEEGWVDEREYRTGSETDGIDTEIALGVKLGITDQDTRATERLVGARTRPPGGLWEGRTDCVPAR